MNRRRFIQSLATASAVAAAPQYMRSGPSPDGPVRSPVATLPKTSGLASFSGGWTIAVMPDTQHLACDYHEVFMRQTEWLAVNRKLLNVRFVIHEGDIVNNNTHPEWHAAKQAMNVLARAEIPYSLATGNHDLGVWGGTDSRATFLNEHFTARDYRHSKAFGLFERQHIENSWHRVATPHGDILIISLEFGPRPVVLEWASRITGENSGLMGVVVTHAYLYTDNARYDWERYGRKQTWNPHSYPIGADTGAVTDAQQMWDTFISHHSNIRFVLSGHVLNHGTAYLATPGRKGVIVHQILANYQGGVQPPHGYGGAGYTRLMHFKDDRKTVMIKTYSPWYDHWLTDRAHDFSVTL